MSLKGAFGKKKTTKTNEPIDENKKIKLKIEKDKKEFQQLKDFEKLEFVKEKIITASREDPKNVDHKKLSNVATKLAEEEGIKEAYLNKNFKSAMEYFQTIPKENKRSTLVSGIESTPQSISQQNDDDEEEIFEDSELFSKTNEKIKIKLVITEIAKTNKDKTIRKILSPFASTFDLSPQCGMFHSALSIGPWYLEWTNRALCVPKKIYSQAALICVDIDNDLEVVDVDFVIEKITEVIARWNVLHPYDKKENNCQAFVDDILLSLDIDPHLKFKGQLGSYVKKLRTKGECKIEYDIPSVIREKCGFKHKTISFQNHKELDEFLKEVIDKFPKFLEDYRKTDAALLKSFDRAFWLRHYRDKKNADWQPLKEEGKQCCPFGDPEETRSFGGTDCAISGNFGDLYPGPK
eukprot:gene1184-10698_t